MYKAIITDLDRTLLHTDKTISAHTLQVLKRCREAGIFLMAATARPLRAIEQYRKLIAFDALAVMNGAQVLCGERKECFGMNRGSAEAVLEQLCSRGSDSDSAIDNAVPISIEMGDEVYSNVEIPDFESVLYRELPKLPPGENCYKIIVTLEKEAALRLVEEILPPDLYYTVANGHLIQIMSRTATKWRGIKRMLEAVGCTPKEAIYFGDDFDDIEPIKRCGLGVAVANAIPEVLEVANAVAASNDEDGVARFLEEHKDLFAGSLKA